MRRACCRTLNRVQPLWMLRLSLVHMMSGGGSPSTGQGSFMVRPRRTLCRWATRSDTLGGPSCRERERERKRRAVILKYFRTVWSFLNVFHSTPSETDQRTISQLMKLHTSFLVSSSSKSIFFFFSLSWNEIREKLLLVCKQFKSLP